MKIEKLILGDMKTNCYVVSFNGSAIVIDPACSGKTIDALLRKNNYSLKAIFLTHGHPDHIGAVDYLYSIYKCSIIAHIKEKEIITGENPSKLLVLPSLKNIKVTSPIKYFQGDFYSWNINGLIIDGIHTPGHSEGSVIYVLRNYNRIFSGDTLFKESIGRTDLPTSNKQEMLESLKLFRAFKDDCKVYPGHGDSTTIGSEKLNNRYL